MYNYSQPPLFSNPYGTNEKTQDQLADAYKKLELLKQQEMNKAPERNAFSDISEELKGLSEDERTFIESSKEYIEASQAYQQAFNSFLIEKTGSEFLKTKYGTTVEKLLAVIKNKKDNYRNKFAEDIEAIKNTNSKLEKNNEELLKANSLLQQQLEAIQKKLI